MFYKSVDVRDDEKKRYIRGKKGKDKEDKIEKREHAKDSKGRKETVWEALAGKTEGHKELCIHLVLSGERCDEEKPG